MTQSVQNDLKEGARARWLLAPDLLARVPAASLYSGRVKGGVAPPYASLAVQCLGKDEVMPTTPGTPYVDRERLTVSVWAPDEDAAGDLAGLVQGAFADEAWAVPDSTLLAVYLDADVNVQEDGTYHGDPVWRADVGLEVWLQRTHPAALPLYRLLDHFDGAGSAATPGHAMDVGPGWTLRTGTWTLAAGQVTPESIGNVLATADSGYADGVVTVSLTFAAASVAGVCVRYADASNYWRVYADIVSHLLVITKLEAGVPLVVAFSSIPAFAAGTYALAVTLSGTTISVAFNGSTVSTVLALLNPTATAHGLYAPNPAGATYGDFQFVG